MLKTLTDIVMETLLLSFGVLLVTFCASATLYLITGIIKEIKR